MNNKLKPIVEKYIAKKDDLLLIPFTTLAEYLHYLRAITFVLKPLGSRALLYLAAAVSDFYIPKSNMVRLHLNISTRIPKCLISCFRVLSCRLYPQSSIFQATHKIQSNTGPLNLHFEIVPKVLRPLTKYWVPDAFVVSFKVGNLQLQININSY